MKKIISIVITVLCVAQLSFAGECTPWKEQSGTSCTLANERGSVYRRQCENNCWRGRNGRRGNWGPNCDQEKICSVEHPDTFKGVCGPWYEQSGTSCYNPNTEEWETKWERACTVGLKEHWCSDKYPEVN